MCPSSFRLRLRTALTVVAGCAALTFSTLPGATTSQAASTGADTTAAQSVQSEPARVIVKFKSTAITRLASTLSASRSTGHGEQAGAPAPLRQAQSLGRRVGLSLQDGNSLSGDTQVMTAQGLSSAELVKKLSADSDIDYVVEDKRRRIAAVVNDPLYTGGASYSPTVGQWYLKAPNTAVVSSTNAESAWSITTGSANVVVAVLDTGVRRLHPDLESQLLPGYDFISKAIVSNDGDGWDDNPSDLGDWITAAEANQKGGTFYGCTEWSASQHAYLAADSSWHGTQTAGLIAATANNGIGVTGIARHVRVLPVRVLGKCGGYDSDIIAAMRWAGGLSVPDVPNNPHPAKVISMSLGFAGTCDSSHPYALAAAELNKLGVTVVASAGNESTAVSMPANCPGFVAVGGLRHTGTKNGYANLGKEVAISAPAGNCVNTSLNAECLYPMISTSNDGTQGPNCPSYTSGYQNTAVGTSFSAPLVSGTIALMLSAQPTLTPAQILNLLKSTARTFPTTSADSTVKACVADSTVAQDECYCTTGTCGAGMLDTGAAVRAAAASSTVARLDLPSSLVAKNSSVLLSATGSTAAATRTLTGYNWSLVDGSGNANFNGTTTGSTASLTALNDGLVQVNLTVSDSLGGSSTASAVLRTGPAPTTTCGPDATDTVADSGGGGASSPVWLLGLALATLVLGWVQRRQQRH